MLFESELRMLTVDGRKTDEINLVIPAPKTSFNLDLNYDRAIEEE